MTVNQGERLKDLVAQMTLKNNYWGYLFARVSRVSDESLRSIMAVAPETNGTISLLYRPNLMVNTDDDTLKLVLEHEGGHLLNKHISRLLRILANELDEEMRYRKSKVWNKGADCSVNELMDMPEVVTINGRPWTSCLPKLFDLPEGQTTEFYFSKLWEKQKDQEDLEWYEYDPIDDHSSWDKVIGEVADISSLSRKVDNYSQRIIRDAAKNFDRSRGHLPGYISELITEALKPPKAPYFQIIRKLVRASRFSKFKRHFAKINRKRTYVFMIGDESIPAISPFPGRARDLTFDISLLLDTSGSMQKEDIMEGLSGIKNIIENDRHCRVTVLENDTSLKKEYEVKRLSDIQFNVKGRGGTELREGLERCRELNTDVTLCFTDGYTERINQIPRKLLPKKIIWVVQKDGTIENVNGTGFIVRI